MTYCAAFLTDHAIYLTTDTVASLKPGNATHKDTFFGEQSEYKSHSVIDGALKIFPICKNRVVAAAGNFESIKMAVNFLIKHSNDFVDTEKLFHHLEHSLSLSANSVQLLCAENSNNELILSCWAAGKGYTIPEDKVDNGKQLKAVGIGSAMSSYGYISDNTADLVSKYSIESLEQNLILVSAYHQLAGVHAQLGDKKAGSTFLSAAMTTDGLVWQPDITYFIYSPAEMRAKTHEISKLNSLVPINVFIRDEIAFVERRVPEYRAVLMSGSATKEKIEKVRLAHEEELQLKAINLDTKDIVFLSRDNPLAVYLHRLSPDYCVRIVVSENNVRMTFADDFYELLLKKPQLKNLQGSAYIDIVPRGLMSNSVDPEMIKKVNMPIKEL